MATHVNAAERFVFGTPLDQDSDRATIPLEPRAGTVLVGRLLLAAIFVLSGTAKLVDPEGSLSYMNAQGIPYADSLLYVAAFAEIAGGLSIAFGFLARVGALGLIVFLVITTVVFHSFWMYEGAEQKTQMVNFMKNLGILGGLALLWSYGPSRYSVDHLIRRPFAA